MLRKSLKYSDMEVLDLWIHHRVFAMAIGDTVMVSLGSVIPSKHKNMCTMSICLFLIL